MDKRPEKKSEETRIGFVTLGPSSGPHFNSMRLIVPNEVRVLCVGCLCSCVYIVCVVCVFCFCVFFVVLGTKQMLMTIGDNILDVTASTIFFPKSCIA